MAQAAPSANSNSATHTPPAIAGARRRVSSTVATYLFVCSPGSSASATLRRTAVARRRRSDPDDTLAEGTGIPGRTGAAGKSIVRRSGVRAQAGSPASAVPVESPAGIRPEATTRSRTVRAGRSRDSPAAGTGAEAAVPDRWRRNSRQVMIAITTASTRETAVTATRTPSTIIVVTPPADRLFGRSLRELARCCQKFLFTPRSGRCRRVSDGAVSKTY